MPNSPDDEPDGLRELRDLRARDGDPAPRPHKRPRPQPQPAANAVEPPPPAEQPPPPTDEPPPEYRVYRGTGRRLLPGRKGGGLDELRTDRPGQPIPGRRRRRFTVKRAIVTLVGAVFGWLLLSLVLFMVSAQLQRDDVSNAAQDALDSSGPTLVSANTILVLGSDARTKGTKEAGANVGGPSRSDSIMLMRIGGGKNAKLSIPRDTVVDIPGHGRDKINSAYALGGAALAITTIKEYLGIEINHLVEVNFENFPEFIDALGGVDYTGGCVVSKINGGYRNGGVTLRLERGTSHLDGKQALALARTRKNECNKSESDLTRARRQQKILSAIRSRATSPTTFFRLPWVSWAAPKAIRSDMGGASLLGLFGAMGTAGDSKTRVLKPDQDVLLPNGGQGLGVSDAEKRREVRAFLK